MNTHPGVNFINIDPESIKITVKSSVSFTLLGSTSVKAEHRNIDEMEPWGIPNSSFACSLQKYQKIFTKLFSFKKVKTFNKTHVSLMHSVFFKSFITWNSRYT